MGSVARSALIAATVDALVRRRSPAPDPQELHDAVHDLLQGTDGSKPQPVPSAESLARQLDACLQECAPAQWAAQLRSLDADAVVLCAALVDKDPAALEVFERRLDPEIRRALRRFSTSEDERQELAQRIRVRLLVGERNSPPQISRFRGWGSLEGWIRTMSARLALNALRDAKRRDPLEGSRGPARRQPRARQASPRSPRVVSRGARTRVSPTNLAQSNVASAALSRWHDRRRLGEILHGS